MRHLNHCGQQWLAIDSTVLGRGNTQGPTTHAVYSIIDMMIEEMFAKYYNIASTIIELHDTIALINNCMAENTMKINI